MKDEKVETIILQSLIVNIYFSIIITASRLPTTVDMLDIFEAFFQNDLKINSKTYSAAHERNFLVGTWFVFVNASILK